MRPYCRIPTMGTTRRQGLCSHMVVSPPWGAKGTFSLRRLRCALRRSVWVIIPDYRQNSATCIHTFFTYRLPPPPPHTHHFFLLFDCPFPFLGLYLSQMVHLIPIMILIFDGHSFIRGRGEHMFAQLYTSVVCHEPCTNLGMNWEERILRLHWTVHVVVHTQHFINKHNV